MIKLKSISAGYDKSLVLDGVNASLEKGKLTCIIGENGCGKSTLLKTIIGILQVADGEITVDGDSISALGRGEIAKRIAYLAQSKSTPDMTVGQMVLHGRFPYLSYPRRYREEDRIAAKTAMESVGILQTSLSASCRAVCGRMHILQWRWRRTPTTFSSTSLRRISTLHISLT